MKYLVEWILKELVTLTLGTIAQTSLLLLSLVMWDKRYMSMSNDVTKYIWKQKK